MKVTKLIVSIAITALLGMGLSTCLFINSSKALGISRRAGHCNGDDALKPAIEAETKDYYVYVCTNPGGINGQGTLYVYFADPKDGSDGIGPLHGHFFNGHARWSFPNGSYTYAVTRDYLIVYQDREVILKQKMISFDEF